jgi:nicotinamidase-related amidase
MVDIGRELDGSEGPHCIEGKNTTELARGIKPMADEYLIQKRRYSAFFGTDLEVLLKCYGVDSVILIGGFTDICVRYTAVDAHQYNYFINVVTDCVSGSSKRAHDDALENIHYLQSRSLVTTQETLDWLDTLVVEN